MADKLDLMMRDLFKVVEKFDPDADDLISLSRNFAALVGVVCIDRGVDLNPSKYVRSILEAMERNSPRVAELVQLEIADIASEVVSMRKDVEGQAQKIFEEVRDGVTKKS